MRERAQEGCPNYFPGEGCSQPGSYVNAFFQRFWQDLYDEWNSIDRIADADRQDARLRSFYRKYRDRFVDSYAVTSPVEDIAETWAFYILSPRPTQASIVNDKLRFFSEYPELERLRTSILGGLCALEP